MENLFLILHKVRGEPAFDIAERLRIGDELGWIIPTSGHRAYPYWFSQLRVESVPMPPDWPDHYTCSREPRSGPTKSLSSLLSIVKKVPKLNIRRIS